MSSPPLTSIVQTNEPENKTAQVVQKPKGRTKLDSLNSSIRRKLRLGKKSRPLLSKKWIQHLIDNSNLSARLSTSNKNVRAKFKSLRLTSKQKARIKHFVTGCFTASNDFVDGNEGLVTGHARSRSEITHPRSDFNRLMAPKPTFHANLHHGYSDYALLDDDRLFDTADDDDDDLNDNIDTEYCEVCMQYVDFDLIFPLRNCEHQLCIFCAVNYVYQTLCSGFTSMPKCHHCVSPLHQLDILEIIHYKNHYNLHIVKDLFEENSMPIYNPRDLYDKYERVYLYRTLATIPHIRFCPQPDCNFALIADNYDKCPEIKCMNKKCGISFCYHCKLKWHPNETCMEFQVTNVLSNMNSWSSTDLTKMFDIHQDIVNVLQAKKTENQASFSELKELENIIPSEEVKLCPKCFTAISKSEAGSCNLMHCIICDTAFCWLCMKPVNDTHFFTTSGCTYYGTKPWSKKKKLKWRIMMMLGGPLWILIAAGVLLPATLVGLPAYAKSQANKQLKSKLSKVQRKLAITGVFAASLLISPFLYALLIMAGVPFALGYIYGVTPAQMSLEAKRGEKHKLKLQHKHFKLNSKQISEFLVHSKMILRKIVDKNLKLDRLSSKEIQRKMISLYQNQLHELMSSQISADSNISEGNINQFTLPDKNSPSRECNSQKNSVFLPNELDSPTMELKNEFSHSLDMNNVSEVNKDFVHKLPCQHDGKVIDEEGEKNSFLETEPENPCDLDKDAIVVTKKLFNEFQSNRSMSLNQLSSGGTSHSDNVISFCNLLVKSLSMFQMNEKLDED